VRKLRTRIYFGTLCPRWLPGGLGADFGIRLDKVSPGRIDPSLDKAVRLSANKLADLQAFLRDGCSTRGPCLTSSLVLSQLLSRVRCPR
jgi:hypothetical protein